MSCEICEDAHGIGRAILGVPIEICEDCAVVWKHAAIQAARRTMGLKERQMDFVDKDARS